MSHKLELPCAGGTTSRGVGHSEEEKSWVYANTHEKEQKRGLGVTAVKEVVERRRRGSAEVNLVMEKHHGPTEGQLLACQNLTLEPNN